MQTHYQTTLFQFLMVRLKGMCGEATTTAFVRFQFLMVRLKDFTDFIEFKF